MPMRARLSVISTLLLVGLAVGGLPSIAEAQFRKRLKDAVKRTAEDKAIQKATDAEGKAIDNANRRGRGERPREAGCRRPRHRDCSRTGGWSW
jgi:hypothetical protein